MGGIYLQTILQALCAGQRRMHIFAFYQLSSLNYYFRTLTLSTCWMSEPKQACMSKVFTLCQIRRCSFLHGKNDSNSQNRQMKGLNKANPGCGPTCLCCWTVRVSGFPTCLLPSWVTAPAARPDANPITCQEDV